MDTLRIRVVLFDGFEPLDVCGPAEVLGYLGQMKNAPVSTNLQYISRHGDKVPLPVYLILACRRKY